MANYSHVSQVAWQQFSQSRHQYGYLSERDEAALYAQFLELQILKSPHSAMFPPLSEMIVNGSNGNYRISGFVDSQNSYGATVRTQFSYNIRRDMYGQWTCADQFVDSSVQIGKQIVGTTILWWVLGILGTIITMAVSFIWVSSMF